MKEESGTEKKECWERENRAGRGSHGIMPRNPSGSSELRGRSHAGMSVASAGGVMGSREENPDVQDHQNQDTIRCGFDYSWPVCPFRNPPSYLLPMNS